MENLEATTQESDISTITDENEVRKAGNGSGQRVHFVVRSPNKCPETYLKVRYDLP